MPLDFPSSPTNGQVYGNYYYNSARGAWNALLPAATPNFFTNATLNTSTLIDATATASVTSVTPLIVKSLSGQTTNIQSWQDSSTTLAGINQFGGFYTSNRLTVGASSISTSAIAHINTINAGNVGLLVKGSSSQTANLQEWQNSSGTILSYVDSAGNINFSGSGSFVQSSTGRALFATNAAATTPLTVKAAASQTADLQQWQSSTGAVLSEINSAGELQVPRIGVGSVMPTATRLHSTAESATEIPIIAQGASGQTADLQRWTDSSGNIISKVGSNGAITNGAFDFILGNYDQTTRGSSGSSRALVKLTGSKLYVNYGSDFAGGTVIDSDTSVTGRLSISNQPAFYSQGSGNQTLSGAQTNVVMPMVTVTTNIGNCYNNSTYRFTAPVAGTYFFWAQACTTTATSTGAEINLLKNGSPMNNLAIAYDSAFYNTFGASHIVTLAANDYVQMAVTNNNGTTFTVERGRSRFAGYLIG